MMYKNKITLIDALKLVVSALENDTIDYKWEKVNFCNCGLVAQAITGTNKDSLWSLYLSDMTDIMQKNKKIDHCPTWSERVAEFCPLTGEPLADIFKKLYAAGMKREDIAHLEYLSDPKILEAAGSKINKEPRTETVTEKRTMGWLFFQTEREVPVERTIYYYQVKENLIAYLKTWIEMLDREKPSKVIIVDGEEFRYRNSFQLEKLKNHFLKLENYKGVSLVQEALDQYKN